MYTDAVTGKQFECTELHSKWTTCKDCENSREKLTRTFVNASGRAYEALMGDYSSSSIRSAQEEFRVAKQAIEQAGGVVNGNHEVSWPEPEIQSVSGNVRYGIWNTVTEEFVKFVSTGVEPGTTYARETSSDSGHYTWMVADKNVAKEECARINLQYKPQYRFHTVVTIVFDPEV